MYEDQTQN